MDDQILYSKIEEEMEAGALDDALWARVLAEHGGDEKKTRKAYIKHRFEHLRAQEEAGYEYAPLPISASQPRPRPRATAAGCLALAGGAFMVCAVALRIYGKTTDFVYYLAFFLCLLSVWFHRRGQNELPPLGQTPERPAEDSAIPFAGDPPTPVRYRVIRCCACEEFLRIGLDHQTEFRCPHCGVKQVPPKDQESS